VGARNTHRMHEVVELLRRPGVSLENDWLRRIGPANFARINFRGTMRFGVERNADALIKGGAATASRGRIAAA